MQRFQQLISPRKEPPKQNHEFYNNEVKQLPENFADDLFHYEMEIEQDPLTIDIVNKLLDLYANAVEYYETIQHQRYLIFKNKTQQLLLRPNVIRAMSLATHINKKKDETPESISKNTPEQLNQQENKINYVTRFQQKKKEYRLSLQYIHQQDMGTNIHQLFDAHKKGNEQFNLIIHKNLEQQSKQIQLKLLKRKKQSKINIKNCEKSNNNKLSISYENPQESAQECFDNFEKDCILNKLEEKLSSQSSLESNSPIKTQNQENQILSDGLDFIQFYDVTKVKTDRKLIPEDKQNRRQQQKSLMNFEDLNQLTFQDNFLIDEINNIQTIQQQMKSIVDKNQIPVNQLQIKQQINNKQQPLKMQQKQEVKSQQQFKSMQQVNIQQKLINNPNLIQNKQNVIKKFQAPQNFMIPF